MVGNKNSGRRPVKGLTKKQKQILGYLNQGLSIRGIAAILNCSRQNVAEIIKKAREKQEKA